MINRDNATNVPGIFAAGDVTDQKINKLLFLWVLVLMRANSII